MDIIHLFFWYFFPLFLVTQWLYSIPAAPRSELCKLSTKLFIRNHGFTSSLHVSSVEIYPILFYFLALEDNHWWFFHAYWSKVWWKQFCKSLPNSTAQHFQCNYWNSIPEKDFSCSSVLSFIFWSYLIWFHPKALAK